MKSNSNPSGNRTRPACRGAHAPRVPIWAPSPKSPFPVLTLPPRGEFNRNGAAGAPGARPSGRRDVRTAEELGAPRCSRDLLRRKRRAPRRGPHAPRVLIWAPPPKSPFPVLTFSPANPKTTFQPRIRTRCWFSPNGAAPYQPRAERSAALGWIAQRIASPEGALHVRGAGGNEPPLQGFGISPHPNLGRCPRLKYRAPLGLNRHQTPRPNGHARRVRSPSRSPFPTPTPS